MNITRRAWDEGPYQLENQGLPIARPRIYEQSQSQQDVHSTDWLDMNSACEPIVQMLSKGVQSNENPNFEQRVKLFRAGYETDGDFWAGDILMPLCVGPFQPYESVRSGSSCNKYIPFVEQLQVEMQFNTNDPPANNPGCILLHRCSLKKTVRLPKQ